MIARAVSLDDFRKCDIPGCSSRVYVPFGPARCGVHGGSGDTDQNYDAFGEPVSTAAAGILPRLPADPACECDNSSEPEVCGHR